MKNALIKNGFAIAALGLSASVAAWDSFSVDQPGTRSVEMHLLETLYTNDGAHSCAPGPLGCPLVGSALFVDSFYVVTNKTSIVEGGAGVVPVAECYDSDTLGDDARVRRIWNGQHSIDGALPTPDTVHDLSLIPDPTVNNLLADVCTNVEGKIVSGSLRFCTVSGPLNLCIWSDVGRRTATTVLGGDFLFPPSEAEYNGIITDYINGVDASLSAPYGGDGVNAATNWAWSASAPMAYLTCDSEFECGQFSKSVPVPAFAAGALGLGLFGITLLTGRRKSIK